MVGLVVARFWLGAGVDLGDCLPRRPVNYSLGVRYFFCGGVRTGASRGMDPVPLAVSRILRVWIVAVQALLWSSLALRMHEFGWRPYWATLALTAYQLFMLAPLMTCVRGVMRPSPQLHRWLPRLGRSH